MRSHPPAGGDHRFTFVVVVNDFDELGRNLFASEVRGSDRCEWIVFDNTGNRLSEHICALYAQGLEAAKTDLVFFVHQDVFVPPEWESQVMTALAELEAIDPDWGVAGPVGVGLALDPKGRWNRGHWADPGSGGQWRRIGPLPAEVQALDELCLGVRRSSGVGFDPKLPGFHCYGMDLSLTARAMGLRSWAIDAPLWHKRFDPQGNPVIGKAQSRKIVDRRTPEFQAAYERSKAFVREKWRRFLPFRSTSTAWD